MKFVVDTNRLIAALIKDSVSRRIIVNTKFELRTPHFSKLEILKYQGLILKKSRIREEEFSELYERLFANMQAVDETRLEPKLQRIAVETMKPIDYDDWPFLALALQENCAIWSDDRHFQAQKKARVFTTRELAALL